jgi:hypothetical protein
MASALFSNGNIMQALLYWKERERERESMIRIYIYVDIPRYLLSKERLIIFKAAVNESEPLRAPLVL